MAKIKETFSSELPPVDNGIIRSAKLLGLSSRNGRRYEGAGLEKARDLYEGRKVYVDHPKPTEEGTDRSWDDWAGVIENVQYRKGEGLFGDVVLRQESAYFKGILEVAANPKFRKSCGFSHVAEGESHYDGDTEIIESIKQVYSVDLVTDPATTAGIFESVQPKRELRQLIESLPDSHAAIRKTWLEMMDTGFGDYSATGGDQEQPTDPMAQLTAIVRDTITALADVSKALAKASKPEPAVVTPPPAAPGKSDPTGTDDQGDAADSEEEMSDDDKEKIAAFESMKRENAELRASKLLWESDREITPVRLKALANCGTEDEQVALLESWPTTEEASRPARSPAALLQEESFPRDNPEKFAALLR